ncbi:MAG: RnfABCDGE type electron transport complex subunit D [Candidatus Margulisbacteria bacterium]|nr:RnfABCDGE type electron transport complex subunit D [Candidatus Margulisiibacteriota bacterium]
MSFNISVSPHIRLPFDAKSIMWVVVLALLFPAAAGVYFFGLPALVLIVFTTLVAVITEAVCQWLAKRPITAADGSAVVTGLLLALILPPTFPLWMAAIGAVFAIGIVKVLFGGLGFNIFNPALAARAFLLASWPVAMTTWIRPFDAVTTATPLFLVNKMHQAAPGYWDLFIGNRAGSLGETSVLAILIGALVLLLTRVIDWPAPAAFIGSVALFSWLLGHDPWFAIMSGGLMIGAFFMATDYVTAPVTTKGRFIFGLGCGIMTVLIRYFGGFPEGVNYSILFMNILTPLIDRYARPKLFGGR